MLLPPVRPGEAARFASLLPQLFKFALHWITVVIQSFVFFLPFFFFLLIDSHIMLPQVMRDPIFEHVRMYFFLGELILYFFQA